MYYVFGLRTVRHVLGHVLGLPASGHERLCFLLLDRTRQDTRVYQFGFCASGWKGLCSWIARIGA